MLGLGIAVALNVDALHVMQRLTADKTFRDAVVREASSAQAPESGASAATPRTRIEDARHAIDSVAMPVGWLGRTPVQLCRDASAEACEPVPRQAYRWFLAVLGWLITAFAVMLGAPFWFDVLNKFMVIRSTVKRGRLRGSSRPEGWRRRSGAPYHGRSAAAGAARGARCAGSRRRAAAALR